MSSTADESLVRLSDISFAYGKRKLLNKVSLTIEPGQLVSIAGKSGSGKSTLLYILGAFIKPQQGTYTFAGKGVFKLGEFGLGKFRRLNLGYVFQDFRLLQFLTVEQNIRFPFLFSGKKFDKTSFEDLLKNLGIENRRKAYPKDISGGEAQRCAIGRAMVLNPRLLLLDEPTGNLDEKTEAEILNLLLALKREGLALIIVTHSPKIIEQADVSYYLADGVLEKNHQTKTMNKAQPKKNSKKAPPKKKTTKTAKKKASPKAKAKKST